MHCLHEDGAAVLSIFRAGRVTSSIQLWENALQITLDPGKCEASRAITGGETVGANLLGRETTHCLTYEVLCLCNVIASFRRIAAEEKTANSLLFFEANRCALVFSGVGRLTILGMLGNQG